MASTTAGEGTSYEGGGGGAGGKFRKRLFRRPQMTPYERPPTALRNPENNGWLPKLVDPASKLISASAHMFFPSVFRKRLPPPSPPENQESRDRLQETVPNNPTGVQGPAIDDGGNRTNSYDSNGISELEKILKQKTFTRSEIDRLTELLHSKTVDLPNGDEEKKSESNAPEPVSAFERQDEFASTPIQENRIETQLESQRFHGCMPTPGVCSLVVEEDVASPAELAKAYMGSRPSKVSPSMLGLRSQALREDASLLNNVPFPPRSPIMSLVKKPAVLLGVRENGFMTPRYRGSFAVYNMERTPYSRVNLTATRKGTGYTYDSYGGPSASSSSSHGAWEPDGHRSKQLVLKRRSSILEADIGSVGPIRRLRQKTNLFTPKNLSMPVFGSSLSSRGTGFGSDTARPPTSSSKKLLSLDETRHGTSKTLGENEDNVIPSTSYTPVPSKSTEMASRIFQQLEMLVPKEKSEGKLVATREKSPNKLMLNMVSGQALRSLEDVDSSKKAQNSHKLEDLHNTCLPDARDTTFQKEDKVEEHGPKKFVISCETLAPVVISHTIVSVEDTVPGVKIADSVITPSLTLPQKKQAFQSAYEDFVELDDENHSNEAASTLLAEGKEKLETSMVESKAASAEVVRMNKASTFSKIAGPVLKKSTDLGTVDASADREKNTSFAFPTAPASSTTFQRVVATPQSTSGFDGIVPLKEPNAPPPLCRSSSKNLDKVPSLTFSSSSSASGSLGLKSSAPLEPKPESSNSLANVPSSAPDSVPKIPELDTGDNKNTKKSGDLMEKAETSSFAAVSNSLSASFDFSFGAPANNSSVISGSLASSRSVFSSCAPVLASGDFTNQTSTNSRDSTSAAAPSFLVAPIVKFGSSSVAPSISVSTVSTTSSAETTDLKAKTEKGITIGNLSSSSFGGTSYGMASTGSGSTFGFSASAATSSANNLFQGSLFGTSSGSFVETQVSPAGTGIATAMQNMPMQFGSSALSPAIGISGTTSFTSSSSLLGSSTCSSSLLESSNPKVFGSSTSFGMNYSASSSETNSVSCSSATSSLFGSSQQPTTSSIFNSALNSVSPSTGFSFETSSISVVATNSDAPMVFGSSTSALSGSIFSFTSAAASSQAQPVFGSSVPVFTAALGNGDQMNMEDSMAEDPVQASIPAVSIFAQSPISTPPSGFVFGSTAPSVGLPFQFGSQQNQSTSENPSLFQTSGSREFGSQQNQSTSENPSLFQTSASREFGAGGSFSLGSGGGDKPTRKIVRVKHKNRRR